MILEVAIFDFCGVKLSDINHSQIVAFQSIYQREVLNEKYQNSEQ